LYSAYCSIADLAIQQLKENSAPGEFFRQIPATGRFAILRLFNAIWRRGGLPKAWKHAIVLPMYLKSGKNPHRTSSIVIPTDIANINIHQTDGETGEFKPANVVSG